MARPRLGESASKRLQMVITEDELEAIDEWQHDRRIASRSEAIRRLCQIGMIFDHFCRTYGTDVLDLLEAVNPNENEDPKLSKEDAKKLAHLIGGLLAFGGKAFRFSGDERLQDLLENDAYLKRLAREEDIDL